jgi:hypothetical protein
MQESHPVAGLPQQVSGMMFCKDIRIMEAIPHAEERPLNSARKPIGRWDL